MSGSRCWPCMGAEGGVGRAGALAAHGGQRRGGRAGALHLGVAAPRWDSGEGRPWEPKEGMGEPERSIAGSPGRKGHR